MMWRGCLLSRNLRCCGFSACACSFLWYAMMKLKIVYMLTGCFVVIESKLSLYAICNRHYRYPLRGFTTCHNRKVIP